MTKIILIILSLAGSAPGAEFEISDRLTVDGSSLFKSTAAFRGNVAVGTAAVSGARLAVIGSTDTAQILAVGTSAAYNFVVSTTGNVGVGTTAVGGARLGVIGSTDTAQILTVGTSTAYNFVVSTTGNVGIGTAAPASTLEVNGIIKSLSGGLYFSDGSSMTTAAGLVLLSTSGNLALGTTGPQARLDVTGYGFVTNTRPVFNYTGAVQTWVVPSSVTSISVDVRGAKGAANESNASGGLGGRVQATISVTPGETLYIYVGGQGGIDGIANPSGGWNGGGNAGSSSGVGYRGGGGGGASDIRRGGTDLSNRVIVAGGGGGGGGYNTYGAGGNGGYPTGSDGTPSGYSPTSGTGGTQSAGGTAGSPGGASGSSGAGGAGGGPTNYYGGGGGGGGYYGGGGGGYGNATTYGAGGGGGSSWTSGPDPVYGNGVNGGDGSVVINYTPPIQPALVVQSGDLAIGTTMPTAILDVVSPTTTGDALKVHSGSNGNVYGLYVSASGNVGVGTAGPTSKFQVDGGDLGLGNASITGNQPMTIWLLNGGATTRSAGEIVIIGNSDNSFTATTSANSTAVLGVVYDATISGGAIGRIAVGGVVPVQSVGATTRGYHVATSCTSGKAGSIASPAAGASIGVWLETLASAGTGKALLR